MSMWLTLPVIMSVLTAVLVFFTRHNHKLAEAISGTSALFTLLGSVFLINGILDNGPQAVAFGQWLRHLALYSLPTSFRRQWWLSRPSLVW